MLLFNFKYVILVAHPTGVLGVERGIGGTECRKKLSKLIFFYTRFALSLHKKGCTSAIANSNKFDLPLHSVCTIFVPIV